MALSNIQENKIDKIFKSAVEDNRNMLYEHEVYRILEIMEQIVPKCVFIKNIDEVTDKMMSVFNHSAVLKVVSRQIAHKQKIGGVKIVQNNDPLFIQFVLTQMTKNVLSHFEEDVKPDIEGYLILEFVPYSQAIGYEVMLGFKEDDAFGPVLTFTKGGDDAEFFAKWYDPANIFVPPLTYKQSYNMMIGLNIYQKFLSIDHPEYIDYYSKAIYMISELAWHYSTINTKRPSYIFEEFDLNPIVISHDNRFIAIDGYATFRENNDTKTSESYDKQGLEGFFRPKGIAVIGVSSNLNKTSFARDIAHLLLDLGRDDVYLVNNRGGNLELHNKSMPLYKTIDELPVYPDLIIYAAPAKITVDFLASLKRDKETAVILISGVPQDIDYNKFKADILKAKPPKTRLIGPNCMGVYYAPGKSHKGLNSLFLDEKRLELKSKPDANTILITQSGALAVIEIDKLTNTGIFKSVVSFGNKSDVGTNDLLSFFAVHPEVDVIAVYMEGLERNEGREFFELCLAIEKPIIAYKAGRTEAGARAAASHTASLSGSYDVFKAAAKQSNIILASTIEEHTDYVKIFSMLSKKIPSGNRVAGVVNAGFESTYGADELINLKQAAVSDETIEKLNTINTFGLVDTHSPFLDVTPMADDEMYADFVECLLKDDNVDCVFVAIVPHSVTLKTDPESCNSEGSLANRLSLLNKKYKKPMVISVNAGKYYLDFIAIMERAGLPVFTDIRSAINALDVFTTWHLMDAK